MPFELFHQSIVSRAIVDCFKFLLYQKKNEKYFSMEIWKIKIFGLVSKMSLNNNLTILILKKPFSESSTIARLP